MLGFTVIVASSDITSLIELYSICSQDLLTVCRELNLEDSVEELMKELGADEHGRISYKDFLSRRLALRPEIEALRCNPRLPRETVTPEYLPTSSDNSLGEIHTS